MGCSNYAFIPGPCPPGVQCTYDSQGYDELVFELKYTGNENVNITRIEIWQTLETYRTWNITTGKEIVIPSAQLSQGDKYYFKAEGLYAFIKSGITYTQGPFYVKITISNNSESWFVIDNESLPETVQVLTETDFLLSNPISRTTGWNFLIGMFVSIGTIYVVRRRMNSSHHKAK